MSHACKNLLIRCMDFRLNEETEKWIKKTNLFKGGFDVISIAGASKSLADGNEGIMKYFMNGISVSVDLHKAERIIIFHHSDCGAYAKSYSFLSPKEERNKQAEDMKKSKKIILNKYPKIEIYLVWGQLKDDSGKKIEFEIIL